jgi:ribosomal protein L15
LAKGVIGYPVKVLVNKASASAREMFEKIGGSIEIVKKVEPLKKKVYVKQ